MQTTCRRLTGLLALIWFFTLTGPPAYAATLQSGIHGMVWGGRAGDYPRLEKIREEGDASYYVDRQMAYRTAGQPVSGLIYGFYRDRLFAAYIKLRSPNQPTIWKNISAPITARPKSRRPTPVPRPFTAGKTAI